MTLNNKRATDGSQPWWLSAIYKVGVPAAIACYLVYFLAHRVDFRLENHNDLMIKQGHEASYYMKEQKSLSESQTALLREMLRLMQQNCINTARAVERSAVECIK